MCLVVQYELKVSAQQKYAHHSHLHLVEGKGCSFLLVLSRVRNNFKKPARNFALPLIRQI